VRAGSLRCAERAELFLAGLNPRGRPVGNLLFLGPNRHRKDARSDLHDIESGQRRDHRADIQENGIRPSRSDAGAPRAGPEDRADGFGSGTAELAPKAANGQFLFSVTQSAKDFLLPERIDLKYGARHLKRAIERYVVFPLASLSHRVRCLSATSFRFTGTAVKAS
jgi:C-terminal, D2-small domain, of ClpB protein